MMDFWIGGVLGALKNDFSHNDFAKPVYKDVVQSRCDLIR